MFEDFYNSINLLTYQATSSDLYSIYLRKPLFVMGVMKFFASVSECESVVDYYVDKVFASYSDCFHCFVRLLYECSTRIGFDKLRDYLLYLYYIHGLASGVLPGNVGSLDFIVKSVGSFLELFKVVVENNKFDFIESFKCEKDVQSLMFFTMKMFFPKHVHVLTEYSTGVNRFDLIVSYRNILVAIELKYIVNDSQLQFLKGVVDQVNKYLNDVSYLFVVIIYNSSNESVRYVVERVTNTLKFEELYDRRFKVITVSV